MSNAPRLRAFFQALRTLAFLMTDSVVWLVRARRQPQVSVIVRLDALGDLFIWLQSGAVNISRHARENGGRAVLVANAAWADYARHTQLWDDVVPVVPLRLMTNPFYRLRTLVRVRRLGAEQLIQPRAARVLLQEDAIARISGARVRIGSTGTVLNMTSEQRTLGNRFYDRLIKVDTRRSTHELIRNEQFAAALTGSSAEAFTLPDCEAEPVDRPYVAVALGAGQSGRIWPLYKLAELITHVRSTHPELRIALLGVPSDQDQARQLERQVGGLENFVGNTDLAGYVRMVARAKLVICNDSSAYHIGMASHGHVVCFLGGGHYGWFAPYPSSAGTSKAIVLNVPMECYWCNWNCRWPREAGGAFRCVAAIPVQTARAAIDDILSG